MFWPNNYHLLSFVPVITQSPFLLFRIFCRIVYIFKMNCWSDQNLHFAKHTQTFTFTTHSNNDLDCETTFNPEPEFHGVCCSQRLGSA